MMAVATGPTSIICAVTGASGGPLAMRLLSQLALTPLDLHLVFSKTGAAVFAEETGIVPETAAILQAVENACGRAPMAKVALYPPDDFAAPIASGSVRWEAMVICPCSLGMAARIAAGVSDNLIARAADVALKERRTLVLVPRETPLSSLHLENLAKLARLGAIIIPPMLTFYHHPRTVEELLDFIVGRILQAVGLPSELVRPWRSE